MLRILSFAYHIIHAIPSNLVTIRCVSSLEGSFTFEMLSTYSSFLLAVPRYLRRRLIIAGQISIQASTQLNYFSLFFVLDHFDLTVSPSFLILKTYIGKELILGRPYLNLTRPHFIFQGLFLLLTQFRIINISDFWIQLS